MIVRIPLVVLVYGLLGLIPFLAPPLAAIFAPNWQIPAAKVLTLYGALILSFLGGARWGAAVIHPAPSARTVSLAMLPTLVGLSMLLLPVDAWRLTGLAAALGLQWLWDIRSPGLPAWYPRLRSILTAGAVVGLVFGAVLLP